MDNKDDKRDYNNIDYEALKIKYINLMSNLHINYNKTELCKHMDVSYPTLVKFLNNPKYRDMYAVIHENLKAQCNVLGSRAFKQLLSLLDKTSNPKLLQIALEMSGLYTSSTVVTNRYDDMKDTDLDKALSNLLKREQLKRTKEQRE